MRCLKVWLLLLVVLIAFEFDFGEGKTTKKPSKSPLQNQHNGKPKGKESKLKSAPNKKVGKQKQKKTTSRPTTLKKKTAAPKKVTSVHKSTTKTISMRHETTTKQVLPPMSTTKESSTNTVIDLAQVVENFESFASLVTTTAIKTTPAQTTTPKTSTSTLRSTLSVGGSSSSSTKDPSTASSIAGKTNSTVGPEDPTEVTAQFELISDPGETDIAKAGMSVSPKEMPTVAVFDSFSASQSTNLATASPTMAPLTPATQKTVTSTPTVTQTFFTTTSTTSTRAATTTARTTKAASVIAPMMINARLALPIAIAINTNNAASNSTNSTSTFGASASTAVFANATEFSTALGFNSTANSLVANATLMPAANSSLVVNGLKLNTTTASQNLTTAIPCAN